MPVHQPPNHPGGPRRSNQPPRKPIYYENGVMRSDLVDNEAKAQADEFSNVNTTQLRRFYEHVMNIHQRLDLQSASSQEREQVFSKLRPEFKLLKARAFYAASREKKNKPISEFLDAHTKAVETAKDFDAFRKHFEAIIAFHKYFYGDKKGKEEDERES